MRRFAPQQKIEIIRKYLKSGISVYSICREFNISKVTFYKWLSLYKRSRKNRIDALTSKVRKGKLHPKSFDHKQKLVILSLVHKHPEYSSHKIAEVLGIGNFGVQTFLYKLGLNKFEQREAFSKRPFWSRQSVESREGMMDLYGQGWNVSDICRHFKISKPIFYKWKRRWDAAREAEKRQALTDRFVSGSEHYKYLDESKKAQIVELVKSNPEFSVHKIHKQLAGEVGHYTVQDVLKRAGLNTYEQRLAFANAQAPQEQIKVSSAYVPVIPIYKWRMLFAPFKTVPKLLVSSPVSGILVSLSIFLPLSLIFLFLRSLVSAPAGTSTVGLIFASIALFFGLFFFIYSMKYYITVLLVLKLAQSGGGQTTDPSASSGQGKKKSQWSVVSGQLLNLVSKLQIKLPKRRGINPLLVNLAKIDLQNKPFVSIHVAVFNEKVVIERLIRACTSQEWSRESTPEVTGQSTSGVAVLPTSGPAAYEVVIADDSTDETTQIAKQALLDSGWNLVTTPNVIASEAKQSVLEEIASSSTTPRNDTESLDKEIFVFTKPNAPTVKLIHRFTRTGFKGGALQEALVNTDPRAQYVVVFDADFVPYPDTIEQFVKTFQVLEPNPKSQILNPKQYQNPNFQNPKSLEHLNLENSNLFSASDLDISASDSRIAAVQGYQWHVLNKSANWITRGVRTEYAGSYVIERSGEEIYQGLKQIAGSVYAIRADVLRTFGWGTSITEDFELTLRLYEAGYKVAFTPYIQAPAEAVSTIKRLIRQRMRWAEGASFNIKVMLPRLLTGRWVETSQNYAEQGVDLRGNVIARSEMTKQSDVEIATLSASGRIARNDKGDGKVWVPSKLTLSEKLEFIYLAPYYLQAAFFIVGTLAWFISEAVLHTRLPFWTAAFGWSLVFTNLLALPLMNIVGLFLEESDERDYIGILSFIALSYIVVPFQAYAAIKGFLEISEGPWFRTPKTGLITDVVGRSTFSKLFGNLLRRPGAQISAEGVRMSADSQPGFTPDVKSERYPENTSGVSLGRPAWKFVNPSTTLRTFGIRPRHMRYVGNLALGVVIAVTVLMSIISPFVPIANTYASETKLKTVGNSSQKEQVAVTVNREQTTGDQIDPKQPENKQELLKSAKSEEITKSRVITKQTKGGKKVEFIFDKEAKVRIKLSSQNTSGTNEVSEIEFETKTIGGKGINPAKATIFEDKEVIYHDVLPDIDIKYTFGGDVMAEEVIVKSREAAELIGKGEIQIEQDVKTVDVKVVSPDNGTFGFFSNDGKEIFSFSRPFVKDAKGEVNNDLRFTIHNQFEGHRLVKSLGGSAKMWLFEPDRAYPVSIDPSVIVSGGFTEAEGSYGGLQRKVAFVNSRWWAVHADGNIVRYQDSADGVTWDAAVTMSEDSSDTDNYNPSIAVSNNFIHFFWVDDGDNEVHVRRLNTTGEAKGTECLTLTSSANISSTYMVSVAQLGDTSALVAFSDTTGGTAGVDVYEVTGLDGACAMTDVHPGNITFGTQGAGLTDSDRPVVFGISSTTAGVVFQDGTDLSFAYYDASRDEWRRNNQSIDTGNTDTVYSVTTDGTSFWVLSATTGTNTANFYKCCTANTGIVETSTAVDTDIGAAGDEQDSDADIFCPAVDNCKIVFTDDIDTTTPDLVFIDCENADCSSKVTTILDSDISGTGGASPTNEHANPAIYCVSDGSPANGSDNCKIVYGDDTDTSAPNFNFVDCTDDEDCSTNTINNGISDNDTGNDPSIPRISVYCVADDNCKVFYKDASAADVVFVDCGAIDCADASATVSNVDNSTGADIGTLDIYCVADDNCKMVYTDEATAPFDVVFVDCGDATCSGTAGTCTSGARVCSVVDADIGSTGDQMPVRIDCVGGDTDCKFIYADLTDGDMFFVDCVSDADCSTNAITQIDATGGAIASGQASLHCVTATDCKGVYVGHTASGSEQLYMFDCDSAACDSGSVMELASGAETRGAIYCVATDDCKLAYYKNDTPTLRFADCTNENCLPEWATDTDPFSSVTALETVSITYDSSNSDLYAHVIMDDSDQAYWKSTDATTISWGLQTSYGFSAGTINQISAPEKGAGTSAIGVVVNQGSNFEFAALPENTIYLALLAPFLYRLFKKRKDRGRIQRLLNC